MPGALVHCLQNPKWPLGGSKMANGVQKGVYCQLSLNMKWEKKKENNVGNSASQPPECQQTRTPTTRAKNFVIRGKSLIDIYSYPKMLSEVQSATTKSVCLTFRKQVGSFSSLQLGTTQPQLVSQIFIFKYLQSEQSKKFINYFWNLWKPALILKNK